MHFILALIFIAMCGLAVLVALRRPHPLTMFAGTLCIFATGYYGLPMLLIERSALRYLPEAEIVAPIAMALLFMVMLLVGMISIGSWAERKGGPGLRLPVIDQALLRHFWVGLIACNAIVIGYNATNVQTFYQVSGVEAYLETRSAFSGMIGFFLGLAQALSAVYFAMAIRDRNRRRMIAAAICTLGQMAVVATAGQRLIFITPIIMVMAALVSQRAYRTAGIALASGIVALLIISPFAVALRSGAWNDTREIVAENFTYGDSPLETMVQSIVDRGDILQNTVALKGYVDSRGYVNAQYYYSVLTIPVPRFVYPGKPYILSDTGTMDGEASIIAWRLLVGNSIGSLTAFGPIVAYREGGWLWLPINGLLTGGLFAFLLSAFSRGGTLGNVLYVMAFFNWGIMKVPPSFMEAMVAVMTYLPVIAVLVVINQLLQARVIRGEPAGAAALPAN